MGIFKSILGKIFHPDSAKAAPSPASSATATPASAPATATAALAPAASPAATPVPEAVDVGAVLQAMADMRSDKGGNYQKSIVDLLKLLNLDPSLSARKELADEIGVRAGADGSAEQNIALHRAVMNKLAENGGIVPDSLRQ